MALKTMVISTNNVDLCGFKGYNDIKSNKTQYCSMYLKEELKK